MHKSLEEGAMTELITICRDIIIRNGIMAGVLSSNPIKEAICNNRSAEHYLNHTCIKSHDENANKKSTSKDRFSQWARR